MSDETKPETKVEESAKAEEPKPPQWEYKTEFAINNRMKDLIHKTIQVSETEVDMLRKKLERLTYGG